MDTAPGTASDAERFRFVFGDEVGPREWAGADEDERTALVEKHFGELDHARMALRVAAVSQIVEGDPPQVWPAAQRLAAGGLDVEAVLNHVGTVLAETLADISHEVERSRETAAPADDDTGDDEGTRGTRDTGGTPEQRIRESFGEIMARRLDRLPLPSPQELEDALVAVAAERTVLPLDDVVAGTPARFPAWDGDTLVATMAEQVVEELIDDEGGPLVLLPGDVVGHVDGLRDGIVLTHVLTDAEQAMNILTASFDLSGFGRIPEPSTGGEPLDGVSAGPGHLAWRGPDGWLEPFGPGTTLAVRADAGGALRIEMLPDPPAADDDLVELLRRVYHRAADEPGLPVSGEELVFGMLAEDRTVFDEPRPPLQALCEAAGLEQRGSEVAHSPDQWATARHLQRAGRVHAATEGDDDLAGTVLDVLGLVDLYTEGGRAEPAQLQEAVDALTDVQVLALVSEELLDDEHGPGATADPEPVGAVATLAGDLVDAARRHDRAPGHHLASLAAELGHDLDEAERHLHLAVDADPDHLLSVDRLAWYASDRGDAATALRLWRRCPRTETISGDIATVEPFAGASEAEPGRNERCWCGSGRKYKQCHLGVVATPPLPDRVGWLHRKAVDYLDRGSASGRFAIVEMITAAVSDLDDEDRVRRAMRDPLVADLVLTEGGWFARFLAEREALLPDDEAHLAATWTGVRRTVHEVVAVETGPGLTLRDLRTGDRVEVPEPTLDPPARPGSLICGRALPDGRGHQLVGAALPVAAGTETELLDLLDGGDPHRIAAWAAAARQG